MSNSIQQNDTLHLGQLLTGEDCLLVQDVLTTHAAVLGMTGSGKCLAPDTPVLMYDGTIQRAVDVKQGQLLMGPDSTPRKVLSTTTGRSEMFRITPTKGDSWVCNDVHVLTLRNGTTGEIVDIALDEYLAKSEGSVFRRLHKQFSVGVDFPPREDPSVDPYFLGAWFGDGHKSLNEKGQLRSVVVSKPDEEILATCKATAQAWGLTVTTARTYPKDLNRCLSHSLVTRRGYPNKLLRALRELVGSNIRVPASVRLGSKRVRLEFLAGFLDTDGHLDHGVFEFTQKREDYIDDVFFIAKSLGFQCTRSTKNVRGETYHRLHISGDTHLIPTRISRKRAATRKQRKHPTSVGFSVESIGVGDYAGFTLDGDGRFLLGDFTVTHNTGLLLGMAEGLIDNDVPIILVDIKGDMINLALQSSLAPRMAVRCLTPGGDHGEMVNVLADLENKDKIVPATTAILKLVGEDHDPIKSKAHSYLATILEKRHQAGNPCHLVKLIHAVQDPGFHHLGAMDLDYAFPKRSRTKLAGKLNNILVAPSFRTWREGVALSLDDLLAPRSDGRTPVLVYSVAHLVDQEEQQLAIQLLLEEVIPWMRRQGGSTKLRTALFIDECVGLLPPHPSNPPTKRPLLTLLKQARAFGVSVVLASQNPVDLDYKGMSNCGTWMIGRLQMGRDKARVIQNVCAASPVHPSDMETKMGALQQRQFILARPSGSRIFQTRNVHCQLAGPLTDIQIRQMYVNGELELPQMSQPAVANAGPFKVITGGGTP